MDNAVYFGGALLVAAGIYQLTPLKDICLSKCRTPISFVLASWREGYGGAFRMGTEHGVLCLGCCWLLFLILFPLGMMNIAVLALITLLIFAEKSLPIGRQVARAAAVGLIAWGALVFFVPDALPMAMDDNGMEMSDGQGGDMGGTPGGTDSMEGMPRPGEPEGGVGDNDMDSMPDGMQEGGY
jgi:hypothetical protein